MHMQLFSTSKGSLNEAVRRREVHLTMCEWISAMLQHILVYASINGKTVSVSRGFPQGGVPPPVV